MPLCAPHPEPVPLVGCYQVGGPRFSFYIRSTFLEFYEVVQLFEKLEKARLAFRRCTWRGDFGGAVTAEITGDQAEEELKARLSRLRLKSMEPIPAAFIRDVIAERRVDVDRRFQRWVQQDPIQGDVELRTVPRLKTGDSATPVG